MNTDEIKQRLDHLNRLIADAASRSGRNPNDIKVIAVTKTHPLELVRNALIAGLVDLGENKVQEAKDKFGPILRNKNFTLHMVGHLQTNKVRQAVEFFDIIHSVDSQRLAAEIDRRSYTRDIVMPILIQVNTSREKSKYGIDPDDTLELVKKIAEMKNIRIKGLMTIGALSAALANDKAKTRSFFKKLRELRDFIAEQNIPNVEMSILSMGMTGDFEIAVEEGATHLRIGTALFGKRRRTPRSEQTAKMEERVEAKPQ